MTSDTPEPKTEKRGGPREGSGRPPEYKQKMPDRRTVRLPVEYIQRLEEHCMETGLSESDVLRRGLELVLPTGHTFDIMTREKNDAGGWLYQRVGTAATLEEGMRDVDDRNRQAGVTDKYELWYGAWNCYPNNPEALKRVIEEIGTVGNTHGSH